MIPPTDQDRTSRFDHVRCGTCGKPWNDHTADCSRHEFRPSDPAECVGKDRGGSGKCCDRAGEYNGFGSDGPLAFVCPNGCDCHD